MNPHVRKPPRLLLGASLLFWGALTGNAFIGLLAALLIESPNWIRFRWKFDDTACARAWRISMILSLITATMIWLDSDSSARYTALPRLMTWMPLLLLPLQFVQVFGMRDQMALNSFSFFSKLHRERNRRMGLADSVIHLNFGNLYFLAVIAASSLGTHAQGRLFFPGLVLLGGWLVFSRVKLRPFAFASIMLAGAMIGFGGQKGLSKLYEWSNNLGGESGFSSINTTARRTAIGSLGKIKQSPELFWRLRPSAGSPPPRLLRTASYNKYIDVVWKNDLPTEYLDEETLFRELSTQALTDDGEPYYLLRDESVTPTDLRKKLPSFNLRGAAKSGSALPLPGSTATLQHIDLDVIEINPVGSVQVFPKKSIISGDVRWGDSETPDAEPWQERDFQILDIEREAIDAAVRELGLQELPTAQAKVARIRQWFDHEFEYTRYLTIRQTRNTRPTAITVFLTTGKRGHCEYFATAATLLLRAAGVPARYCVGFAVMEKDPKRNEYLIRGTHGHAWSRFWDGTKWVDFDATPSGWLAAETAGETQSRWLPDTFQRLKEDFFLWRNRPANRLGATIVMWAIGISVLLFVARRLWKSKTILQKPMPHSYSDFPPIRTPLHELESSAKRLLGPRQDGTTFATWLSMLSETAVPAQSVLEAINLHQRLRFDPENTPPETTARLQALVHELEIRLNSQKSRHHPSQSEQEHSCS